MEKNWKFSKRVVCVSPKIHATTSIITSRVIISSTQGDDEKQLFLSTIFGLIEKNVLKFDEQAFKRVSLNNQACLMMGLFF